MGKRAAFTAGFLVSETQLCQLSLLVRKAKLSGMVQSTEDPFSLLKQLGKSHPVCN